MSTTQMLAAVEMINYLHERVQEYKEKHPGMRCAYRLERGSILNAYREGDITFKEAVAELKRAKS